MDVKKEEVIKKIEDGNEQVIFRKIYAEDKNREFQFFSYERLWVNPETNRERVSKRLTFGEKDFAYLKKLLEESKQEELET